MSNPILRASFILEKKKKKFLKFHDSPTKSSGLKMLIRSLIEWAILLFLLIHHLDPDACELLTISFNAKWVPPYFKGRVFWELHFCALPHLNALGIVSAFDRRRWISFVSGKKKKKNFFFFFFCLDQEVTTHSIGFASILARICGGSSRTSRGSSPN